MRKSLVKHLRAALLLAALLFVSSTLWHSACRIWRENACHKESSRAPGYADLIAGLRCKCLGYVATNADNLDPTDRERVIHMSWELSPGVVKPISSAEVPFWDGALVGPAGATRESEERYESCGYQIMAHNESAVLRSRIDMQVNPREERDPGQSSLGSLFGVLVSLGLLGLIWYWLHPGERPSLVTVILGCGVFAALTSVALRYGLTSPNGLATYAGKAKLFILAHGIPPGFFSDQVYAVYQPSYPPLMVLPPLISFALGGFGTFWPQLLVPFILSLVFVELSSRSTIVGVALAAAYVLCPIAQQLAVGYYAEPLCALLLILGYGNVRQGRATLGWAVVGTSGLVRSEGMLLAAALWLVDSTLKGHWKWRDFLWTIAPGVAWQLQVVPLGAHLLEFDFLSGPSAEGLELASKELVSQIANGINGGGLAVCTCLIFMGIGLVRKGLALIVFWLSLIVLGGVLLACSTSVHLDWIVERTFGRYMWLVASFLVYEICSCRQLNLSGNQDECLL